MKTHGNFAAFAIGPDSEVDAVRVAIEKRTFTVGVGAPLVGRFGSGSDSDEVLVTPHKTTTDGALTPAAGPYLHRMQLLCYREIPAIIPERRGPARYGINTYTFAGAGEERVSLVPWYGRRWGKLALKNRNVTALTWRVVGHVLEQDGAAAQEIELIPIDPASGTNTLNASSVAGATFGLLGVDFLELRATAAAGLFLDYLWEFHD